MDSLIFHPTKHSPKVHLDAVSGLFEISGGSIPEDTYAFYEPIIDWIEEYVKNPVSPTILTIHLTYFNTSSSKQILEIFRQLEIMYKNGSDVLVKWLYLSEEEDMLEAGQDYESIVKIPFEMVALG